MKKICFLFFSLFLILSSNRSQAQLFGADVIVHNVPTTNQHNPDVAVAFNGWVYDAFAIDTGYVLRVSRDGGQTWNTIDEYSGYDSYIKHVKVTVGSVGTDTTSIKVFLMVLEDDSMDYIGQIYINSYDGYADSFIAQNYYSWLPDNAYRNIDIASDYQYPAVGASPYSIGAAYTVYAEPLDSVIYIVSTDGGDNYTTQYAFDTSSVNHFRNVSISYGRSSSASNGRYFLAWDEFDTDTDPDGRIFTARTATDIVDAPTARYRLDTVGGVTGGLMRKPSISVSANNTDNDSSSCTAIVTFERDLNANGANIDVLGTYNFRAHYTDEWQALSIDNDADKDLTPNICFEPVNNKFYLTYFDSTNKRLKVVKNDFNLGTPSAWTIVTNNYADDSSVLDAPNPVVGISPTYNDAVMTWAAPLVQNNVVLFDAQAGNIALAVKTAEIMASNAGSRNRVDWRTATEDDGSTFTVQRSTDGRNFSPIGVVQGKGSPSDYTYWDEQPASGMNYYRLRTTDAAGIVNYTQVVSAFVKEGNTFSLQAFPNPVTNTLNLYISGGRAANSTINVTDLNGKVLLQQQLSNDETSVDMSRLATGIYLLKYSDAAHTQVIRVEKN
jgi:hypothetical protein